MNVTSEIGRLRRVLLHPPGPEVDRMVPTMMEQLLFDDILYGDRARDEHARFRRVLQLLGVETLDAQDLLTETLEDESARRWVIDVMTDDLGDATRRELERLAPPELASTLVCGLRLESGDAGAEVEELYGIPPLPNWCFQRDPQVVLGRGVILTSMAAPARQRETLLTRAIFRFHPRFSTAPVLFDPLADDRRPYAGQPRRQLEGGDLLVLSPELLVVGLSERTNRRGVRSLARAISRREEAPRWIVAVEIPRRRAFMHLDTLITVVDRDACLVHAPVILPGGSEQVRVWQIDLHAAEPSFAQRDSLLGCLTDHGVELAPIICGGDDPVAQQREQWTDGANALALAPGVITLYDRNLATAEELSRHGFEIVQTDDLLLGRREVDIDAGKRVCILVPSHEISRARGGPHCLVHPLLRD